MGLFLHYFWLILSTNSSVGGKAGSVKQCDRCRGSGRMFVTRQVGPGMIQQMAAPCDQCNGQGLHICC